jgi:cysteine-rich repeat protein
VTETALDPNKSWTVDGAEPRRHEEANMKIIALLMTMSLVALGCDQEQDVGDNDGGDGGSGGSRDGVMNCLDAACGDSCLRCPPNDPQCNDPTELGFCSNDACVLDPPQCTATACGNGLLEPDSEQCDDGNQVDGDGCSANCTNELSCQTKACGEGCMMCSPNEPNCLDPSYQGYCDLQGVCVAMNPTCQ